MGPRFVGLAAVFYAMLFSAGVVLNALRGHDAFALGDSMPFSLLVGIATACGTVALSVFLYRLLPALRKISDDLAPRLVDGARRGDLVLVSAFSGVGEETFFRCGFQPMLGLVVNSILFVTL